MSFQTKISNGAAKVGVLQAEDLLGQVVVKLFRGAAPKEADPSVRVAFDGLIDLINRFGRRPFVHHGPNCDCLGADEAVLLHLVRLAGQGAQEDTLMIAMMIVRADVAPVLAGQAQALALALARDMGNDRLRPARRPQRSDAVVLH